MKRSAVAILAVMLFVVVTVGGACLMYFSPHGILNPSSPEDTLQDALDTAAFSWHDEFISEFTPEISIFEEPEEITEEVYSTLTGNAAITFREWSGASSGNQPMYILSGEHDFLAVKMQYKNRAWEIADVFVADELFRPETHTITITAPSDSTVYVNGIELDSSYAETEPIPYEDMTALENRFADIPHRVRYTVSGLYRFPNVEVQREPGVVLHSMDGLNWSYMPPDAASHSFSVQASADVSVTVNGTTLTKDDSYGEILYTPLVELSEEQAAQLPKLLQYEASGLYSVPVITATDAEGHDLIPTETAAGTLSFTTGNDQALYDAHHEVVEAFIRNIAAYGAAHVEWTTPASFVKKDTALFEYFAGARYSMIWIGTVRMSYDSITSYDYTPLGEDAFLCKARMICTSKTYHQTVDMDLEYEMLWERSGSTWQVVDMAFTDNYSREIMYE